MHLLIEAALTPAVATENNGDNDAIDDAKLAGVVVVVVVVVGGGGGGGGGDDNNICEEG